MLVYLAKVNSALQTDIIGLNWLKVSQTKSRNTAVSIPPQIYHDGLVASTQVWAVDKLIASGGKVSFTIPKCIAKGESLSFHVKLVPHKTVRELSSEGRNVRLLCLSLLIADQY